MLLLVVVVDGLGALGVGVAGGLVLDDLLLELPEGVGELVVLLVADLVLLHGGQVFDFYGESAWTGLRLSTLLGFWSITWMK